MAGHGLYRWAERAVWPAIIVGCLAFWAVVVAVIFR